LGRVFRKKKSEMRLSSEGRERAVRRISSSDRAASDTQLVENVPNRSSRKATTTNAPIAAAATLSTAAVEGGQTELPDVSEVRIEGGNDLIPT
jgi:hypothetical protein